MGSFVDTFIKRPVFATVLILVMVVLGVAGYGKLGVDFFPNIEFPIVTVTTILPGASPREVESEVTDPIEEALSTIAGVDEIRSTSAEGYSMVVVLFDLETNADVGPRRSATRWTSRSATCPKAWNRPRWAASTLRPRRCSTSRSPPPTTP
jgi:HAE1 family hydrophobic/amphiphilic exporter-1